MQAEIARTYRGRVKEIFQRQAFKEFYSRHLSGKISPFIAAACVGTRVTPNALTILMIPTGLAGAALFLLGHNAAYLVGGLFFVALNILDAADGELARYTSQTSHFGDYLDRVAHYCTNAAAVLAMGVGLGLQTGNPLFFYLSLILTAAVVTDDALRDLLVTCGIEKLGHPDERKSVKKRSKLALPSGVGQAGAVLLSNVAFFHIVPIIAFVQLVMNTNWILPAYYMVFATAQTAKALIRGRKIYVAHA